MGTHVPYVSYRRCHTDTKTARHGSNNTLPGLRKLQSRKLLGKVTRSLQNYSQFASEFTWKSALTTIIIRMKLRPRTVSEWKFCLFYSSSGLLILRFLHLENGDRPRVESPGSVRTIHFLLPVFTRAVYHLFLYVTLPMAALHCCRIGLFFS